MPLVREPMSVSQFCDLLGVEPWRYVRIETDLRSTSVLVVLRPETDNPLELHKPRWVKQGDTWVRET